ncbi:solanesyl-diphosphate synthase 2, chloroplastic [Elaeis guineensis]|uniref:all-trans-nonaprenyl-diphosphate synthase [geranyl-diphosphate specific] n=1 Tax=Elaeis guineensis var. tenera TaxID=51953 RepID=A0A6I9RI54_ELAGV|nr:probable solanesyl-diphosphate synthase 3, chloroplastic [Elaeis guineensis]XP_010926651.1 probable solanesyl-diphosphate synthase 3, chloroplastic [Elaeis guineensis]
MFSLTCSQRALDLVACGCPLSGGGCGRSRRRPVWRRSGGARCRVSSTQNVDVSSLGPPVGVKPLVSGTGPIQMSSLLEAVSNDLQQLNKNLKSIVGSENPVLVSAAEQIFGAGGKRLRPALVFLVSRATAQIAGLEELTTQHQRLAEIIEMIHTASLIHDDVLDESEMRRGKATIHQLYGTRVAVLAGDFMFAQSSWYLANLENIEVIKLISQVIKDFASGEIKQASGLFDCDVTLEEYLLKSYYKTASLIAASTKAAAIFSGVSSSLCEQMYEYGKNLGLSFQVVDDILDFTQSAEQLGKPAGSDLAKGNLTAPVIFALEKEPRIRDIINSEFSDDGSLDTAIHLVNECGGIKRAQDLAKEKGDLAIQNLQCLPQCEFRSSLEGMVKYNLERIY